ncbi:MAG TPA: S8 family serine peptidase [Vicinamibacterales bacterium]
MPPKPVSYLPQVIVKFRDSVNVPYEDDNGTEIERHGYGSWTQLETQFPGIRIQRLYRHISPAQLGALGDRAAANDRAYKPRNPSTYFVVKCPDSVASRDLAEVLRRWPSIEAAYADQKAVIASGLCTTTFENAAPAGIDAQFAWTVPGGDGQGQSVIDIEDGWELNHVAIAAHAIPPPIVGFNDPGESSHGTSVLGIICGSGGGFSGIAPNVQSVAVVSAKVSATDPVSMASIADAIATAALQLAFGSVLVIEFQSSEFLPCETDFACFQQIDLATSAGVVVVEAAGNGASDLDAFVDTSGRRTLQRSAQNPAFEDSGAIIVAAASGAVPHQWRINSNFGSRIDCYACGDGVLAPVSSGPGDTMSTGCFFDTSAATAIIAGVALSVQGMTEARTGQRAGPSALRSILSDPATATAATGQNAGVIGVMPDLNAIARKIQQTSPVVSAPSAPTNLHIVG